ncbi:MAG: sulfate ABC transporter permease subunit CysW [Cyanobacterium sp. T60_A2020_053]|nr:sulfate ABC transporter permease subunit CysW [Cyanobacterium sp. T60_A2020_053]
MQTIKNLNTGKNWVILIVFIYLGLILLIPAISVFYEAFKQGVPTFFEAIQQREFIQAIWLTVILSVFSVPLNTVFGLCAAWVIARNRFRGKALLMSIIDLPFSISPLVAGLMMVLLYGRNDWFNGLLEYLDVKIVFALPGMVLATIFVTLPFVAREVIPVLEEIGSEQEDAARSLGATDLQIFWRVTLPGIRWGLLYGVLLTNARAVGEYGAIAVVSGNIIGKTASLPIFVELAYKNYQAQSAFAASVVLVLLAVVTLIGKEILEYYTKID